MPNTIGWLCPLTLLWMISELTEKILVWDIATRQVITRWPAHGRKVSHFQFIRSGEQLISSGFDKVIRR